MTRFSLLFAPSAARALLLAAGFALGAPAQAAPKLDPLPLLEGWLMPRYDALVAAATAQKKAWADFCGKGSPTDAEALKGAFVGTADAWDAVEFVTFGPAAQALRSDRFSFFPDRRNAVSRAMAQSLADPDPTRFESQRFAQSSAAAQGLPALERLLYDQGAAQALAGGSEAARRCALGQAIAGNLASIATEIRTAWGDRSHGLIAALASKKGDPDLFPDPDALPGMMLTDLAGAYQRVDDQRIAPVLGDSASEAKPLLAEGWRAGRSGRIIANMIESADALARAFPIDFGAAAQDAKGRAAIAAAVKAFKGAQAAVVNKLAPSLDVTLGFNALDGD